MLVEEKNFVPGILLAIKLYLRRTLVLYLFNQQLQLLHFHAGINPYKYLS